jgi:hypothetical protein
MASQTVTAEYIMGISEARAFKNKFPDVDPANEIDTLNRTIRMFGSDSAVGQMLRGERDFWRNQIRKGA